MKLFLLCLATQELIRNFDLDRTSSRNKDHDKANKRDQALIFAFIAFKFNQISVIAFRFVCLNLSKQRIFLLFRISQNIRSGSSAKMQIYDYCDTYQGMTRFENLERDYWSEVIFWHGSQVKEGSNENDKVFGNN